MHVQCPRIVALLAESYNPHVRYGAAMAVGLACSASGLPAASRLLEPLMKDAVDFVRQGALIATALVLMQQPESKVPSPPPPWGGPLPTSLWLSNVSPYVADIDRYSNVKHASHCTHRGVLDPATLLLEHQLESSKIFQYSD